MRGERLKFVGRSDEGKPRHFGHFRGEAFREFGWGIKTCPDGGSALGELVQPRQRGFDPGDAIADLSRVA